MRKFSLMMMLLLNSCQLNSIPVVFEKAPRQAVQGVQQVQLNGKTARGFAVQFKRTSPPNFDLKYVFSDVATLRVWLVTQNTGSLTPAYGYFDFPVNFSGSGDTQTLYFDNVPAGSYYVAATALDASNQNITENASNPADVAGQPVYVSDGGGEVPGFPGRVTIGSAPNYTVTGTDMLTLTLVLD